MATYVRRYHMELCKVCGERPLLSYSHYFCRECRNADMRRRRKKSRTVVPTGSFRVWCPDCSTWGTPVSELDRICGNCGSESTVLYLGIERPWDGSRKLPQT